ncbi:MAG: ArnT family glycosyltransferase, partial [Acetobacteraceae bacterium]
MTAIVRPARTAAPTSLAPTLWGLAAGLFLLGVVVLSWTGYTESDDSLYAAAAWQWVQDFPFLGINHWGLRHAIVLPMALLFRLFGRSEATLEAPVLFYYAALLVLTFAAVRRTGGWKAGLIGAVLLGATPTLATTTSVVTEDIPEALFVMASLWAFYAATRDGRAGLFVLSGLLAGLGFITRETTAALLVAYGVL